jgi:hypothetical protein
MLGFFLLLIVVLSVGLPAFRYGEQYGRTKSHQEAIEANAARWTIDPRSGERKFEWVQHERDGE